LVIYVLIAVKRPWSMKKVVESVTHAGIVSVKFSDEGREKSRPFCFNSPSGK